MRHLGSRPTGGPFLCFKGFCCGAYHHSREAVETNRSVCLWTDVTDRACHLRKDLHTVVRREKTLETYQAPTWYACFVCSLQCVAYPAPSSLSYFLLCRSLPSLCLTGRHSWSPKAKNLLFFFSFQEPEDGQELEKMRDVVLGVSDKDNDGKLSRSELAMLLSDMNES